MALADVLRKAGVEDADFLREGMRVLAQESWLTLPISASVAPFMNQMADSAQSPQGCQGPDWTLIGQGKLDINGVTECDFAERRTASRHLSEDGLSDPLHRRVA